MDIIIIESSDGEKIVKHAVPDDDDGTTTCTWVELCDAFFTALLGFGFMLPASPSEMAAKLNNWEEEKLKREADERAH
jgi:hypothetical protein